MLPSARRAELSRQYFDNSYLSRRAFEVENASGGAGGEQSQHNHHQRGGGSSGGSRPSFGKEHGSIRSRTTAGLTTFDDEDMEVDAGGGYGLRPPGQGQARGTSPFRDVPGHHGGGYMSDLDSEFSDQDSLGSVRSGESNEAYVPSAGSSGGASGIRYANSHAGQIWNILDRLDDAVLEVKVGTRTIVILLQPTAQQFVEQADGSSVVGVTLLHRPVWTGLC